MKKHIIPLALILSCIAFGNISLAVDVSTSQDLYNALGNANGDNVINLLNDINIETNKDIFVKPKNFILNGNNYGFTGADLNFKNYENSQDLTFNNIGKLNENNDIASAIASIVLGSGCNLSITNSVIKNIETEGGNTVINDSTIVSFTNRSVYRTPIASFNNVMFINSDTIKKGNIIENSGIINGEINGLFFNHKPSSEASYTDVSSAVIYNRGTIEKIKGTFVNNDIDKASGGRAKYGSAINNEHIIKNVVADFIENKNTAVFNVGTINFENSSFLKNEGGAIYTQQDLSILANAKQSKFSGNYITKSANEKESQAIFVKSTSANLNLKAVNNGAIIFDDKISGTEGYKLNVSGDSLSNVYLNNDIENARVNIDDTNLHIGSTTFANQNTETNVNSGTIHLADGVTKNYNFNKLTSSNSANYTIYIDNSDKLAPIPDKIITGDGSNGVITISDINLTNDTNEFNSQVLVAKDNNIQLGLSNAVKEKFNKSETEKLVTSDNMVATVKWNDKFKTYEQDKITKTTLGLSTTNTQNDSINFTSNVSYGEKTETGTVGDTLTLVNQYSTSEDRNFNFDTSSDVYNVTSDLGTTSKGTINVNGVANNGERSTINGNNHSLFKLDNATNLNVNNVKITGANSVVTGSNKNSIVNLNNVNISNNQTGIKTAGSISIKGNSTIENNGDGIAVTSADSVITLDATDATISLRDKLTGITGSKLKINNGIVNFEQKVSALDVMMENSTANLNADNLFDGNNMTVNSASNLNLANNTVGVMQLNKFTLKDNLNLAVDVDLANKTMDRIVASNYDLGSNLVNVNQMNLLTSTDRTVTSILFADNGLKNNVNTSISEVAYSPIWKYGVNYNKENGNFIFTRVGGDNPTPASYNPAVMVSPVAAQVGGYLGMLDTYNNAFTNMDIRMLQPSSVRVAEKMANRYAITEPKGAEFVKTERSSGGTWVRPFTSYDSVGLKHGPKVHTTSYGSFFGGDTGIHELGKGFDGVLSAHISYLGSHQSFNGNSIYQNGGNIGLTGTLYKGNFFTGLSAVTGASIADASTMYGTETFPVFTTGVANKTGYNVEFKDGRFILQPSLLLSYTYVNTFNYTNAADVKIAGDGLHAVQINPNIRFIANTKTGWQPYLTFGFNWNIMNDSQYMANATALPELSVKPYFKYGLGIQKLLGDNITGYAQIVLRNGGRNGIAANAGFKYMFGKETL